MSQDRGQNDGDFGAIFARIMSAWGQKGIVGCNVMTIHNEVLLLITSGLWTKALQHYSITVPKIHIKRSKIYSIFKYKYRSFLWVENTLSRTAALQHCSAFAVLEVSSKKKLKKVAQKF